MLLLLPMSSLLSLMLLGLCMLVDWFWSKLPWPVLMLPLPLLLLLLLVPSMHGRSDLDALPGRLLLKADTPPAASHAFAVLDGVGAAEEYEVELGVDPHQLFRGELGANVEQVELGTLVGLALPCFFLEASGFANHLS